MLISYIVTTYLEENLMSKILKNSILLLIAVICFAAVSVGGIIMHSLSGTSLSSSAVYATKTTIGEPDGEYKKGYALVKYDGEFTDGMVSQLGIKSATPLYEGSKWYSVALRDSENTIQGVQYLDSLGCFDEVDYDYIMGSDAEVESVDVSCNPEYKKHKHHNIHKIPEGWEEVKKNGKHPGGSENVVIAVIDTGVDFNHLDLRNNIWVNSAEIPNNGIDDDQNGYIDDINGWNCVGNNNNPMDDNGHGTHVAGIIAAENNNIGGVGIAYNCKIMVLKAGNSSGYFNNSDIAEAVQYAYMNGASVINMSFGGSSISIAVEEALENAYNSCVLVAAAGNDSACNNLACISCLNKKVSYPAALPYVIGVMSVNVDGTAISGFSNYDHYPYDSIEYEVYAVGESVPSCWPNNKYADLNGTSMAAPSVSAIAALLRSAYPDRNTYSTKYLQSQIVNTGTINPMGDSAHSVANVYEALTKVPTPAVELYGYSINDSTSLSNKNNGNGIIDAGETVRLSLALQNRGGVATDVNVKIDTIRSAGMSDPYFTLVNTTMALSDIGTYSVRESGENNYFEIIVDSACPNDYLVDFNIKFTYVNGMDSQDTTEYKGEGVAQFNVSKGYLLPLSITEDTTFTADRLYIVGQDVVISEGVTVNFEEGCEIQFYDDREYYNSPKIINYGILNFNGTKENMITIKPNESYSYYTCCIKNYGIAYINYANTINLCSENYNVVYGVNTAKLDVLNSYLLTQGRYYEYIEDYYSTFYIENGSSYFGNGASGGHFGNVTYINNFILYNCQNWGIHAANIINNCIILNANDSNGLYPYNFCDNFLFTSGHGKEMRFGNSEYAVIRNNYFADPGKIKDLLLISKQSSELQVENNKFSPLYQQYASQVIEGYYDASGNPIIDVYGECADYSVLYPHVRKVQIFNKDGEEVSTIGKEEITIRVTFNRAMDTTQNTFATFGTKEPYADYRIDGKYISSTVWEGKYTLKAQIENGLQYLKINNACQSDDATKKVWGEYQLHEFNIDTTAAMAMNLQAVEMESGIKLTWTQDEYDTLLGYNIYRSTEKDGNFVKLNPAILLSTDSEFVDENALPGETYWYTYTVVLSDFTESAPAGKVMATAMDTLNPTIYHTPINQGYLNNNLIISCLASDNVGINSVTLYYRTIGETTWKTLAMSKNNDKYSATVFGNELSLEGLEYYIVATDGRNSINKGSSTSPYIVVIKDASTIATIGDVDGDGVVSTKDALMLMQCINGDLILTDDQFKRADLNKDNVLSSVEALRILQYINGKVITLEM